MKKLGDNNGNDQAEKRGATGSPSNSNEMTGMVLSNTICGIEDYLDGDDQLYEISANYEYNLPGCPSKPFRNTNKIETLRATGSLECDAARNFEDSNDDQPPVILRLVRSEGTSSNSNDNNDNNNKGNTRKGTSFFSGEDEDLGSGPFLTLVTPSKRMAASQPVPTSEWMTRSRTAALGLSKASDLSTVTGAPPKLSGLTSAGGGVAPLGKDGACSELPFSCDSSPSQVNVADSSSLGGSRVLAPSCGADLALISPQLPVPLLRGSAAKDLAQDLAVACPFADMEPASNLPAEEELARPVPTPDCTASAALTCAPSGKDGACSELPFSM
jgi:hypothetical protein